MKTTCLFIAFCTSIAMFSQNFEEAIHVLKTIESSAQVDSIKTVYPQWQFFETTYAPKDMVSKKFNENNISTIKNKSHSVAEKLLETASVLEFRVSYIYLNGDKRPKAEIDSLRQLILEKFNENTPFSELAKKYSDDPSASKGGDLGWFPAGRMVPTFENAIRAHRKGAIFLAESLTSRTNWYFVILKTHEDRATEVTRTVSIQVKNQ